MASVNCSDSPTVHAPWPLLEFSSWLRPNSNDHSSRKLSKATSDYSSQLSPSLTSHSASYLIKHVAFIKPCLGPWATFASVKSNVIQWEKHILPLKMNRHFNSESATKYQCDLSNYWRFGASLFSNGFNNSFYLLNTGYMAMCLECVVWEEGDYIIPTLKRKKVRFREDK